MRPGPERLEPGLAPDGIVIHVYDRAGVLLLVRRLHDRAEAQAFAESDADHVVAQVGAGDICMVVYDGDTGARQRPDVLDGPHLWRW
jgi:hypothetical protein